MYYKIYL